MANLTKKLACDESLTSLCFLVFYFCCLKLANMIPYTHKGWNIVELSDVDSTNTWIHDKFSCSEIKSWTAVRSANQKAGRGQRGNSWLSEPGANLLFSFLYQPKALHATQQFLLSQTVSLAVVDWLLSFTPHACIKWPNDIYVGEQKIAGILIENILLGEYINASIVGIGININQTDFSSDLPNPISLAMVTHKTFDIKTELNHLLDCMERRLHMFENEYSNQLSKDYTQYLLRFKKLGVFTANNEIFDAQIVDVLPSGEIVLKLANETLRQYGFKEVRHVFESGFTKNIVV